MRQMDEMTQHNAALVEETNAAIEQTESAGGRARSASSMCSCIDRRAGRTRTTGPRAAPAGKTCRRFWGQGSCASQVLSHPGQCCP